ncbi:MAG: peptidase C1 [Bacteroidetes bacterium]|nr:peptidase C1 [Bacteroidota bacterium]
MNENKYLFLLMPIRMSEDDDSNEGYSGSQDTDRGNFGGGGSGFPGGGLINLLLPLLFRYPKLLILVLLFGGGYYFFNKGCSDAHHQNSRKKSAYATGATLDKTVYDKNEVFATLDNGEPLPDKVSLENFAPIAGDQGEQGSCVGWGSTYCARTILEATKNNATDNKTVFSPAFTYNQIGASGCQGAYITNAVKLLSETGAVPYNDFPYNDKSCEKQPNNQLINEAQQFRMKGATRLTLNGNDYTIDVNAIRQNLAKNAPVIIGMAVGGSFMQQMEGHEFWQPNNYDYSRNGFGGHCMCIIGYDDNYFEQDGAFLIQNSWGAKWGINGRAWVSYKDMVYFTNEAYGINPIPSEKEQNTLSCKIELVLKKTKTPINLNYLQNNEFESSKKLSFGDKFKIKLTNSAECYIYIFGKETDGGSYILFPYTKKHSAYCGITGLRVFPRDYSLEVDKIGTKDEIAILISKEQLDFKAINETFNKNKNQPLRKRVLDLFPEKQIEEPTFKSNGSIDFNCILNGKTLLPILISITKQ